LDFTAFNKFEQNVCKALKVRESQKVALGIGRFSTGFSTDCVENLGVLGPGAGQAYQDRSVRENVA
jgi:hypothetical protein